ncbi:PREDICTED: NAC domain-containing protein 82 [Camelina sativa]|uniref:NAC domain-containing protein 82 n=1 Tax=Camelina sativa TaxID=90675 RepID=A0ABM0V9E9_CAMSA|nr:PREDICTED: NAC domain-containing protein 82 [Camelina sativa]XP_010452911.1 PREDICTED: NAC domain-containing protein 82 [Camelina sativa]
MGKTKLAPGFRFHPTDVELVRYYLKRKILGKKLIVDAIAEVDIYKFEPPDLPDMSYIKGGDLKWHFFCPREKKYASGVRANRATDCGYWKTTGKERPVLCNSEVVGKIKTLIYHFGKSPRGERTDWVMHEYRLEDKALAQMNVPQDTYVVCVLFKKDGPGPRNGAQYGAPFRDEDWSDEEERTDVPTTSNPTIFHEPSRETSLAVTVADDLNKDCFGGMISESCVSDFLPTTTNTTSKLPDPSDAANTHMSVTPLADTLPTPNNNNDDLYAMLDLFDDDEEFLGFPNEAIHNPGVSAPVSLEDIFNGLPDLGNMHNNMPRASSYDLIENSELYLELQDLTAPLLPPPLTAPLNPQTGNVNDSRSSYLYNQGHFDFSGGNDDGPYGFSANIGHGPDSEKR